MYHWANDRGYIGHDDIPKFTTLDGLLGYDQSEERQILWEHEWKDLSEHLRLRGKDQRLKQIDQDKHTQTYWYFKLAYETGMRLKEINTLRWNQVITPIHETGHSKELNRSIYLAATKTSRKRTITAPITYIFNGLLKLYKSKGIDIDTKSDTRVFFKLFTHKHDIDAWYTDKAMVDKLDLAMKEIGLYQKLEKYHPGGLHQTHPDITLRHEKKRKLVSMRLIHICRIEGQSTRRITSKRDQGRSGEECT